MAISAAGPARRQRQAPEPVAARPVGWRLPFWPPSPEGYGRPRSSPNTIGGHHRADRDRRGPDSRLPQHVNRSGLPRRERTCSGTESWTRDPVTALRWRGLRPGAAASAASPHQPSFVLPRASASLTVGRNLLTTANQTIGASTVTPVEAPCSLTSMVGVAVVGVAGFEPTASSSRTKRATKLRYTPLP